MVSSYVTDQNTVCSTESWHEPSCQAILFDRSSTAQSVILNLFDLSSDDKLSIDLCKLLGLQCLVQGFPLVLSPLEETMIASKAASTYFQQLAGLPTLKHIRLNPNYVGLTIKGHWLIVS